MIKFRGEFIALYGRIADLQREAQSDRDKTALQDLLDGLESMSRQAHNGSNFTYTPLAELASLQ
jgi:hypothetical protein